MMLSHLTDPAPGRGWVNPPRVVSENYGRADTVMPHNNHIHMCAITSGALTKKKAPNIKVVHEVD
ncbi:hypothetical protein PA08_0308 [Cutibacterium modestum P08]|nr:hypothetical protein PA08_0308 [Cutibacterium modestum P08]MCP2379429.1 hypothetical protein [Cutibacterium modestum 31N]